MKKLLLCASASLLTFLSACSGSGNSTTSMQTVSAQSSYSTSSLSGTYSMSWYISEFTGGTIIAQFYTATGTMQLNGSGSITGGTITENAAAITCPYSVTGTYSLQSTATGTATLSLSSSTTGCPATDTWNLALAAGDGGGVLEMARTNASRPATGSAVKQ